VGADLKDSLLRGAAMPYSNLSHANIAGADFSYADLKQSKLHMADDTGTKWRGANLKLVEYTDKDLAFAETWTPPRP